MHLLIDGQPLQSPASRNRGIERYTLNLMAALAGARPAWRIELVENEHLIPIDRVRASGLATRSFRPPLPAHQPPLEVNERYYADWLTAQAADVLLFPSFFDEHALVPHFTGPRSRFFAVLHDLIPLLFPAQYLEEAWKLAFYGGRFRRLLAVDGILANSQATAGDVRNLGGAQLPELTVIAGAPDPDFAPLAEAELARQRQRLGQKFNLERPFILYVAGHDFRKNVSGALRGYAALDAGERRQVDLVVACHLTRELRTELAQLGERLGVLDSLCLPGYVTDEELRALYQLCRVFYFPSLYEGLGLPVLEALRCGAPVVASNRSSIPEFAGPLSWLADPERPSDLAAALRAALAEPYASRRQERMAFAEQFRWERSGERACRALEASARTLVPAMRRRRVAWVSPMPPALSGIADYSADLIGPLSEGYEIDLVLDPRAPLVTAELARRHTVILGSELPARDDASPFDLFVFQLGNSHYHTYMLDLLGRFRGLVVLHDYTLGGLVLSAIEDGVWPATLAEELAAAGESRLAEAVRSGAIPEPVAAQQAALNRRVLAAAGMVLVHSAWTWERVRQMVDGPVAWVPQAALPPRLKTPEQERRRLGLPGGWFVVATIGSVHPAKRIESLLRAVHALPEPLRVATLVVIVGYAPSDQEATLLALARELGMADRVRLVGRVPREDLAAYARAADVCVQLRYPSAGETSAALLGNLAAGAACIISDSGSMGEMPEQIALRVRPLEHEVLDLAAALERLHRNPAERARLREAGLQYVRSYHSIESIVPRYAAVMELAAGQRHSRDGLWIERACSALADCPDGFETARVLEAWAKLRAAGRARAGPARATGVRAT
jgi:glycosyltransferase involved in cell wall biosynthesis